MPREAQALAEPLGLRGKRPRPVVIVWVAIPREGREHRDLSVVVDDPQLGEAILNSFGSLGQVGWPTRVVVLESLQQFGSERVGVVAAPILR